MGKFSSGLSVKILGDRFSEALGKVFAQKIQAKSFENSKEYFESQEKPCAIILDKASIETQDICNIAKHAKSQDSEVYVLVMGEAPKSSAELMNFFDSGVSAFLSAQAQPADFADGLRESLEKRITNYLLVT